MANLIAAAAVSPAAGTISDHFGRRYIALCGSALVIVGMIIVGVSGRIEVAIGGMAIAGVGAGFAEIVGISGIAEIAPAKSRGLYIGSGFLMVLPFGGCAVYGK
jgi:MFS family permease